MTEKQNGFRKGRSCTEPIHCVKLLVEKQRQYNLETSLLLRYYEKAFDSTPRQNLYDILKSRNTSDTLLKQKWTYTHKTIY
jgi:hypothetical protein